MKWQTYYPYYYDTLLRHSKYLNLTLNDKEFAQTFLYESFNYVQFLHEFLVAVAIKFLKSTK